MLGQLLRTLNPEELKTRLRRCLRPHLRILPHPVRRPEGPRRRRVLHPGLAGLADRQRASSRTAASCSTRPAAPAACSCRAPHFVERLHANPTEKLTFYGLEKNATTIRLAKMNLAVHGLEGDIQKAITYYEDPHELARQGRFRDGQSALQRGRDRRGQGQERPAPALRPAGRQQERQGLERQLPLDQLLLQLPERDRAGPASSCPPRHPAPGGTRPRCGRS